MSHDLHITYLRTHRRKTGLSQDEVAYLLGGMSGSTVSRHESDDRRPMLRAALAYEIIYGVVVKDLYAGFHRKLSGSIRLRAATLLKNLSRKPATPTRVQKVLTIKRILEESM